MYAGVAVYVGENVRWLYPVSGGGGGGGGGGRARGQYPSPPLLGLAYFCSTIISAYKHDLILSV